MKPDKRKILQALNYLAQTQSNKSLDKMKAYKLLWLADRYHLRQFGRTITHDTYYALPHGIVPSTAKNILESQIAINEGKEYFDISDSNKHKYTSIKETNTKVFSQTDVEVLDLIISKFGKKTAFQLSNLSHEFPEWKKHEQKLNEESKQSFKIDVNDFFLNHEDETGLFVDDDEFLSITKELSSEMN
jgi:uncharacterized phage-associated protein